MSQLFRPWTSRSVTFRNRIFVAPMCQYSCVDGFPTAWHLVHLGARAVGGAGLVLTEATAVAPEGRITYADLGLWSDEHAQALKPITAFIKSQGAVAGIQIAHAGRKASTDLPWRGGAAIAPNEAHGWLPQAPSAVPFGPGSSTPAALSEGEIEGVVKAFADAARRAAAAGFQVLELHMAHGYLLHEFLSPLSNKRTDQYGGPLANRLRLPVAVASAARDAWPDELPLFVRISATDWVEGGWDLEQSVALASALQPLGVDLIDCSTAGLTPDAKIPAGPGFQTPFATHIRRETGIPTAAVGFISDPLQAEQIVATELADCIFMGRELLRDPYWPLHAAKALQVDVPWPAQYERAKI